ncbi:hypothetical protein ACWGJW_25050, partial [Streptomyces nigrescens]
MPPGSAAGLQRHWPIPYTRNIAPNRNQWKPKRQGPARPGPQDIGAELARLRTENTQLLTAEKEWSLAREILYRAAACFAKEMKRRPAAGT